MYLYIIIIIFRVNRKNTWTFSLVSRGRRWDRLHCPRPYISTIHKSNNPRCSGCTPQNSRGQIQATYAILRRVNPNNLQNHATTHHRCPLLVVPWTELLSRPTPAPASASTMWTTTLGFVFLAFFVLSDFND